MLLVVVLEILIALLTIARRCIGIHTGMFLPSAVVLSCVSLIGFLFVVSAFICNFNNKTTAAIACAVVALVIKCINALCGGNILWILNILPEAMLLVFLFKQKRNIKTWSFIAWGAVFLPTVIYVLSQIFLFRIPRLGFIPSSFIPSFIVSMIADIPLGFVYHSGYTDKNNATRTRTVVKQATATSYLEEYKRKRTNGGN